MSDYGCTQCGYIGDETAGDDNSLTCPDCGHGPLQVYTEGAA